LTNKHWFAVERGAWELLRPNAVLGKTTNIAISQYARGCYLVTADPNCANFIKSHLEGVLDWGLNAQSQFYELFVPGARTSQVRALLQATGAFTFSN